MALLVAFSALPFTSFAQSSASNVTPRPAGTSSTIIGDQNPVLGDGKSPLEKRIESIKPFMTSPQNGQSYKSLDTMIISWTPQSDKKIRFNVRIEPATSSTKYKARNIATNVSGSGTKWKIPRNVPAGDYKISVVYNTKLGGKNVPIALGKATVGINKTEVPVVVATSTPNTGRIVLNSSVASSSIQSISNAQGETESLMAGFIFPINIIDGNMSQNDLNDFAATNFTVRFFPTASSSDRLAFEASSVSWTAFSVGALNQGTSHTLQVSAAVPGSHPLLRDGLYYATLTIKNANSSGSTVNYQTDYPVSVIKITNNQGVMSSFVANASIAFNSVFNFMFGWMR